MAPDYSQNAAHRAHHDNTAAGHFVAANVLHQQLADLAVELDASRPPGLGLPSSADLVKQAIGDLNVSRPEYTRSRAFVSRASPKRVEVISSQYERLKAIFRQYKGTIKHRWEKRTVEKRKVVLIEAWGEGSKIPARRRPNFNAYKRGLRGDGYKWIYLLPSVNLEDLSDKVNLLLFIESRATHEPCEFAWSDTSTVHMASENGVKIPDTFGYNMLLTGEAKSTYGTIMPWGDDVHSMFKNFTNMYEGRGFHLGQGFMCLEIQCKILKFLVKICEILLADTDLSNIVDMPEAPLPNAIPTISAPSKSLPGTTEWSSLKEAHSKARYQVRHQLDLIYLQRLAIAKRDEAWDEIWALREDLSFFQEMLADSYKFDRDCDVVTFSLVTGGQKRPTTNDKLAFQISCVDVIAKFYNAGIAWNMILEDLQSLEKLRLKYGSDISPSKPSPEKYNEALWTLCITMKVWMDSTLGDLALRAAFNSALKQYYSFEIGPSEHRDGATSLIAIPNTSSNVQPPPIVVLLNDLQDARQRQVFGTSELIDEIEYIMHLDKSHKSQKELIDSPTAGLLSEIAAFGEIDCETTQHQPKIRMPKDQKTFNQKYLKRLIVRDTIVKTLAKDLDRSGRLCAPLSDFEYPSHKKQTEQTINQLRAAEAKLDAYWQHIDQLFVRHTGKTLNGLMGKHMDDREVQRTPAWQPPVVQPKLAKPIEVDNTLTPLLKDVVLSQPVEEKSILPTISQPKSKTRGEADPSKEVENIVDIQEESTAPLARSFVLPKKAYKTMVALFPTDEDRVPGKIRWADFVDAMSKLGFSSRQTAGSSFHFQPTWEEDLPISFHRPHPSDEISFAKLRFHASRLARRYGWSSASFVLS